MRKICHITTVHPNRYDVRIFEKECTSLAETGFEVCLIVNDEFSDENVNGVNIVSLQTVSKNRIDRATRIAKLAYKKALEVDAEIYHIHDPELLRVAVKLRKKGKKVIFDSHEFTTIQIMTKEYLPRWIRKPLSQGYRCYESHMINKLSGLIYPCTYGGSDFYANIQIPKVQIGNFPIMKIMREIISEENVTEKQKKVCYIGSITESRGALQMIKAAAIAGKKLVLIGQIQDELLEQLKIMPEFENVEYLGLLPHSEAMKEARKCMVGLSVLQNRGQYPLLDNLPTKLYEYMILGVPTVISNFPFYEKQLEKYHFGVMVDPANELEIAKAINEIIENDTFATHLIMEGRRAILQEMNWELEAKRMVDFYEKFLN